MDKKTTSKAQSLARSRTGETHKIHDNRTMMKGISNDDHESDINRAEQHTRWILTILGIWASVVSTPTRFSGYASKFWLPFPSLMMMITVLIPMLCHVVIRDVSGDELLATLGPISYQTTTVLKNCILIYRRSTIRFCMRHMETDWRRVENRHERDIMLRNLEVGRGLTIIGVLGMCGSAVFFNTKPLFSPPYVNARNQTVRPLAFPGADIFVDLRKGFNYEIVYVSNCVCVFFLQVIVSSTCNLAAVFVTHACGQIQIVMSRLDGLVDIEKNATDIVAVRDRIAFIVRNHIRVLRFASTVDAFLREMCLMEVASSTLVICSVEYYCVTEWQNSDFLALTTYFIVFVSLSFNLFIFCHIGELLKEQCQQVGRASYMIDWYKLPGKTGLALVVIITMANYPCQLTAGQMMELSHYSFGSIMKTSFAYLNMLRSIAE